MVLLWYISIKGFLLVTFLKILPKKYDWKMIINTTILKVTPISVALKSFDILSANYWLKYGDKIFVLIAPITIHKKYNSHLYL